MSATTSIQPFNQSISPDITKQIFHVEHLREIYVVDNTAILVPPSLPVPGVFLPDIRSQYCEKIGRECLLHTVRMPDLVVTRSSGCRFFAT